MKRAKKELSIYIGLSMRVEFSVAFKDLNYFKQVYVNKELGVLCWPGDVDIAPETIYSMATGKPLPEWVDDEKQEGIKQV